MPRHGIRPRDGLRALGALLALLALPSLAGCRRSTQSVEAPRASPPSLASEAPWLVAGPFPSGALGGLEDGLDRDYLAASGLSSAGEAAAAPLRLGGPGSKLWREDQGLRDGAGVDFVAAFGPSSYSVAYAYREISAASPRRAVLKIGSDDGVKVWINGELVLARHVDRALRPDEDAVGISLAKGKNRILVKVSQARGAWGFSLRIAAVEKEAKSADSAAIEAVAAYPDELAFPQGGTVGGAVETEPAFCIAGDAKVELLGPSGRRLAASDAPIGGRFSLPVPQGFSGPAILRASGRGALAGLQSTSTSLIIGDPEALAAGAAAKARRAASAEGSMDGAGVAGSATLEYLAETLEGKIPPELNGFDISVLALAEIDALTMPAGSGHERKGRPPNFPGGLARCAYRSEIDGSLQPFSLYLPSSYDSAKRYGLVVALHGATESDYRMAASLADARPEDMLILAPYGRGDMDYSSTGERDVLDVIDLVLSRCAVDPDRVYLTGRSMGGHGAWRLGQLYPWKFAAIASFAGWTSLDCLENLISTPVLAVHGNEDGTVPLAPEAKAIELLRSLGGVARLDVLPGVGHDAMSAWMAKEGPGRLLAWFRNYRRETWPSSLKLRTTMARYGRGAWATIEGLEKPLSIAALDAKVLDSRHIAVDTENVSAFGLDLRHPALAKGGRILVVADGVYLTADAGTSSARYSIGADGRFAPVRARSELPVNDGSGMAALFEGPLRVVYGSRKGSAKARNEAIASSLADYAGGTKPIPDDALGPEDEASSSLILVGWPEENAILSRLAGRLPLSMKGDGIVMPDGGAVGSGFILVFPNPEAPRRLVGIVALPGGKASADIPGSIGQSLRAGRSDGGEGGFATPDLVIFDGSGKALWTGCFDWKWEKLTRLEKPD